MSCTKVEVWKTDDGTLFENEGDAFDYDRDSFFKKKLVEIVSDFYYTGIQEEAVVEGIMSRIDELRNII